MIRIPTLRASPSTFARRASTMIAGTLTSQVLLLAFTACFARLYAPHVIGVQALFMAWAAGLCVFATMRLDLAVVLPKSSVEAAVMVRLVFIQSVLLCLFLTATVIVFGPSIERALGDDDAGWMWYVGPMCLCMAIVQCAVGMASREGKFTRVTLLNIAATIAFGTIGLALSPLGDQDALVFARFAAQVIAVIVAVWWGLTLFSSSSVELPRISWSQTKEVYRRYRQFIVFNTPYSLLSSLGQTIPIFLFAYIQSPTSAAYYALASTILVAPTTFISGAMSQVFYKEAVDHLGQPRLEVLARRLLCTGLIVGLPIFAIISVWGDVLFSFAFGSRWNQAGQIAMVMAPAMWLCLQTGWIQRIFEAAGAQRLSFLISAVADTAMVVGMLVAVSVTSDIMPAIAVFAVIFGVHNLAYLAGAFRAAGFNPFPFYRDIAVACCGFGFIVACGVLVQKADLPVLAGIAITCAIAAFICGAMGFQMRKNLIRPESGAFDA